MLAEGSALPHFTAIDIHGRRVDYRKVAWQRKHLLLILDTEPGELLAQPDRLAGEDVEVVMTRSTIPGVPPRAIVIADRWGEVAKVWDLAGGGTPPSTQDVEEWLTHVRMRCPECEGETR